MSTRLIVGLLTAALVVFTVVLIGNNGVEPRVSGQVWSAAEMCVASSASWVSDNAVIDFLAGNGAYMARTHCMVTQTGETDWTWVWILVGLNLLVIAGYVKIFIFWRVAYLQESEQDRNKKLMDLAWIFVFCACCGYISSIMLFFWPGYRLLAICLIPLAFFTWKFAVNLDGFRVSLSAKRLARELNESLQNQNERLSRDVELATRDLQEAKAEADRANQAKGEFLARMSHEIRTPLTAIMGFLDIAISESEDNEQVMEPLMTVHRNSDHLLKLIDDVLDVSKIEAGEMAYEILCCSPELIAKDVLVLMQPKANEVGTNLTLKCDESLPRFVMSDPTRVRQLLVNLVGNAIKFTDQGEVSVRIDCVKSGDDPESFWGVEISVCDTGIGMNSQQASHVFDKFMQGGTDITRCYGGTGLGLTISKQIAEDLGGELTVTSELGAGSRFVATIRCDLVQSIEVMKGVCKKGDHRQSNESLSVLKSKRILLVEDSADNIALITHRFGKFGVKLDHASNGEIGYKQVIDALDSGRAYDLVIMDISMPQMDGVESLKMIRRAGCKVPVIMLSAHALVEEQQRCYDAGASAYCTKPINFKHLFEACISMVEGNDARRAG